MFFFGTKQFNKNYGVTYKINCPVCRIQKYYQFIRTSIWFHFFFIPVFPLSMRYYNICPNCNNIDRIKGKKKKKYKALAIVNTKFLNGVITKEEHKEITETIENIK